ncbi:MAG: regulatory iron-sulfur-containing complex subunit RicT [Planctomycetota bacterium]
MQKYVVRHGIMRTLGVLTVRGKDQDYLRGDKVIARTKRGLEVGEVLCEATPEALEGYEDLEQGEILRNMSSNDMNELQHIQSREGDEFHKCQEYVSRLGLEMELVDLEHVFGGERIIVYYLAEKRVDFRELVRQLAREFQTRIEMRQIGVRDEAKLLADYGDCGKPVCCNTHLTAMPPVSMKMAKIQKATLDPTKISGRCGRLKCCLRYEYDTYVEMQRELPPVGSEIVTGNGKATVLGQEILAQQLLVEMEDNRRTLIEASEVISVIRVGRPRNNSGKRKSGKKKKSPGKSNDTSTRVENSPSGKTEADIKDKSDQGAKEDVRDESAGDNN